MQLKETFVAEGIDLYRDDRCYPGRLVSLTNIPIGGPVPADEEDDIDAAEGHVFCDLLDRSLGARVERFVWRNDPAPTYVRVLNVHCSIYPKRREQTNAVERAIRRLNGVSDAPATVPSADAVVDP